MPKMVNARTERPDQNDGIVAVRRRGIGAQGENGAGPTNPAVLAATARPELEPHPWVPSMRWRRQIEPAASPMGRRYKIVCRCHFGEWVPKQLSG